MSSPFGRRWLFLAVGALAAAFVGRIMLARYLSARRKRFPYALGPLSAADHAALAAKPQWSATEAVVAPGITLNGLVRRPTDPAAPWVLFFPGNDAHQLATGQKLLERVRDGRDWGLALYSYRGYDGSSGKPDRDALVADAGRLFDGLLEREKVDPARLHLVAFSLGGHLATYVAGVAAQSRRKVASLSLLASVEDIDMVTPSWFMSIAPGHTYDTRPLLDAVPAPVLVVQGGADEALGPEQGRDIAARLGDRARYLELPGVRHVELMDADGALTAVREMISSHLTSGRSP